MPLGSICTNKFLVKDLAVLLPRAQLQAGRGFELRSSSLQGQALLEKPNSQ